MGTKVGVVQVHSKTKKVFKPGDKVYYINLSKEKRYGIVCSPQLVNHYGFYNPTTQVWAYWGSELTPSYTGIDSVYLASRFNNKPTWL